MAEIKSTLDLIMERTKNLTLTGEEKVALRRKELQAKTKGWIGRYLDGYKEIHDFEADLPINPDEEKMLRDVLREEALAHLEPAGNNERVLRLLEDILEEDTAPISRRINDFQKEIQRQMVHHAKRSLKAFEEKGIRGSAVMPNLDKDPDWQSWLALSKTAFLKEFATTNSETTPP